ncbi:MAG: response regulator transcription factor [Planctomycetota bacterium]
MTIKILIIDDHPAARDGLGHLLDDGSVQVDDSVGSGKEAFQTLDTRRPDVVLLDVRLNDTDGIQVLDQMRQQYPELPVVMISSYENPTYVARSAALGASEYLLKSDPIDRIRGAIRRVHQGNEPGSESFLHRIRESMIGAVDLKRVPNNLPLTAREIQVLRHIALGLSNKEIARSLEISVETVKEHVQNILRKLEAKDRTDAAVRAVRAGIVE